MASDLTYSDFAAVLPHLASGEAAKQAVILGYINQAEVAVNRALLGETVKATATRSRADLAVLNLAGHYYRHYLRSLDKAGEQAVGQVVSIQDAQRSISFAAIAGNSSTNSSEEQWLATTPEGLTYLQLRAQTGKTLPRVAGRRGGCCP